MTLIAEGRLVGGLSFKSIRRVPRPGVSSRHFPETAPHLAVSQTSYHW